MLSNQQSGLTPEKLQLFIAGLSGLSGDEVRKAKLLFIRNEISQLRALKTGYAGASVVQGCLAIIPVFWPVIWIQRSGMKAILTLQTEQIRNALAVWRDDLGADAASLEQDLNALQNS
jgi:hypothetical protein